MFPFQDQNNQLKRTVQDLTKQTHAKVSGPKADGKVFEDLAKFQEENEELKRGIIEYSEKWRAKSEFSDCCTCIYCRSFRRIVIGVERTDCVSKSFLSVSAEKYEKRILDLSRDKLESQREIESLKIIANAAERVEKDVEKVEKENKQLKKEMLVKKRNVCLMKHVVLFSELFPEVQFVTFPAGN